MITREAVKAEIDKVQDKYLEVLYRIVKALVTPSEFATVTSQGSVEISNWHQFIEATYGCLADDPIERGEQGPYEAREVIK